MPPWETAEEEEERVAHAIHELETLKEDLEPEAATEVEQVGGPYSEVRGKLIRGKKGEAHHVIPQSIVEGNPAEENTVLLEHADHAQQPSTGGSFHKRTQLLYEQDAPDKSTTRRGEMTQMLQEDRYAELVRDNVLDVRRAALDADGTPWKYDAALTQYLNAEIDSIRENGLPKAKREEKTKNGKL